MKDNWTKAELFEELDAACEHVRSSGQYEAITYVRKLAARVLSGKSMNEVLGEEIIGGIRVDPPSNEKQILF